MTKGTKRKREEDNIMDVSHINTLLKTGTQYMKQQSTTNLSHLELQLDLLHTITRNNTSFPFLKNNEYLSTECLALLVDLLNIRNTSILFMLKVLSVLNNLIQDEELNDALHSSFNLTSCLANCISYVKTTKYDLVFSNSMNDENTFILKCLQLIQLLTYGKFVPYHENYEELVVFILQKCCNGEKNVEVSMACLGVLLNFIHKNAVMQNRVKNFDEDQLKVFHKHLISHFPGSVNKGLGVLSISVFINLHLNDHFGEKILLSRGDNINQTLAFAMHQFSNGKNMIIRNYAADLITDMIKHTKFQERLSLLPTLTEFLQLVLKFLLLPENKVVYKSLELLINMCDLKKIREALCCIVFEKKEGRISTKAPSLMALNQLALCSVKDKDLIPEMAFNFLSLMYKEILSENFSSRSQISTMVDELMHIVEMSLKCPLDRKEPFYVKECAKILGAVLLHIDLLNISFVKSNAQKIFNLPSCLMIIHYILDHSNANHEDQSLCNKPIYATGAELLLHMIYLLFQFKDDNDKVREEIDKIFSDERINSFLVFGISSHKKNLVDLTIKVLNLVSSLSFFSFSNLAECISVKNNEKNNAEQKFLDISKHTSDTCSQLTSSQYESNKENLPNSLSCSIRGRNGSVSENEMKNPQNDSTIKQLIEQVENNCQVEDLSSSKIISIYEHKYRSLEANEKLLIETLEIKEKALDQQRRLLQQSASQRLILNAEVQELRSLHRDSENKFERFRTDNTVSNNKIEELNSEIDQCYEEIKRFTDLEQKHESLITSHHESARSLETLQRSHSLLKEKMDSKTSMVEMLQKHLDSAQSALEIHTQKNAELEGAIENLTRNLDAKESRLSETLANFEKTNASLTKTKKDLEESSNTVQDMKNTLSQKDKTIKELKRQVKDSELLYQKLEENNQQNLETINKQKAELEDQKKIVDMIRNLTGK